jgi:hypothetical protein
VHQLLIGWLTDLGHRRGVPALYGEIEEESAADEPERIERAG